MPDTTLGWNAANLARVGLAGEALVRWLEGDPRVGRAYVDWRLRHRSADADLLQSVRREKARDLAALDRLVRDDLGLAYDWLAPLLLFAFGVTALGLEGVRLTPEDVGLPAGRRAKGQGQHIARDVEWFYRTRIVVAADGAHGGWIDFVLHRGTPSRAAACASSSSTRRSSSTLRLSSALMRFLGSTSSTSTKSA